MTAQDKDGFTPLHAVSAFWGRIDVAYLLVNRGADLTPQDKDGLTPLGRALAEGREDLARLFIQLSADTTARVTV